MSEILLVILVLGFGLAALVYARKLGAKSAELKLEKERILNEAKERQRAQEIISNLHTFSDSHISDRLQNIAASKRK